MIKILIDNEEVVCNNNISIKEEMLSTSSTILKNCYPASWESDRDYVSRYYFPKDYSKCKIINSETIDFEILGNSTQDGTPTPDNPIPVINKTGTITETIGGKEYQFNLGDIELCKIGNYQDSIKKSTGKNLLNFYNYDGNFNTKDFTDFGSIIQLKSAYGTANKITCNKNYLYFKKTSQYDSYTQYKLTGLKANTQYTISGKMKIINWVNVSTFYFMSKYLSTNSFNNNELFYVNTITTNSNGEYEGIGPTNSFFYTNAGANGVNFEFEISNMQLEENSQATSYEPYGKVWYVEKQIGKAKISSFTGKSGSTANNQFTSVIVNDILTPATAGTVANILSNCFTPLAANVIYARDIIGIGVNTNKTITCGFGLSSSINTLELANQWLQNNNVEAIYALATPTYTEITDETLLNQLNTVGDTLLFCGLIKNTGNISLNPREPHYVDLQVLDFKDMLSTGETLNYVINNKTIVEAINQVVASISDYGFVVGNIMVLNPDDIINAYSTLNKTAYDVFQYIADISQSRWTTRMIDENTVAIDFYDPTLLPTADPIESTHNYFENNKIIDLKFSYSTNDYRNKQIMTSDEVFGNITQNETIIADGYAKNFMCENKIGQITSITVNGVSKTFATKSEQELGVTADFYYEPGEMQFTSSNTISAGNVIVITYYPIVKGREIILDSGESTRISNQINRKGTISRYENRNDTTSSQELQKIGQSYIKYKGKAEITLTVKSEIDLFNVGQIVEYQAPLEELSTEYMVKSKETNMLITANKVFYIYELTSNFNYENAINYFDNQRAKSQGNINKDETITRNIDLESTALIKFYDTEINEITVSNPTSLDFALDGVLI